MTRQHTRCSGEWKAPRVQRSSRSPTLTTIMSGGQGTSRQTPSTITYGSGAAVSIDGMRRAWIVRGFGMAAVPQRGNPCHTVLQGSTSHRCWRPQVSEPTVAATAAARTDMLGQPVNGCKSVLHSSSPFLGHSVSTPVVQCTSSAGHSVSCCAGVEGFSRVCPGGEHGRG